MDGYGLNYTLPMLERCKMKRDRNGNMVQTIPKVIPFSSASDGCYPGKIKRGVPVGLRTCRIPDCGKNLCKNGWCEETLNGYKCHCSTGFQGRHCKKDLAESTNSATKKAMTMPKTGHMTNDWETSTSQETTTSETSESLTTEATTKPTTGPTITMSEQPKTTASLETTTTTTSACTSLEVLNGGSCYYFSTSLKNHASALSSCYEHDSHLVYIETEVEQDFIENQIQALDSSVDYWIGLRGQSRAEASWWDGSQLTYDNTVDSTFADGHECFVMKLGNYQWHDRLCSREYKYICEKEMDHNA